MARSDVGCTDQTKKHHKKYHIGSIKRYAQCTRFVKGDVTCGKYKQRNRL